MSEDDGLAERPSDIEARRTPAGSIVTEHHAHVRAELPTGTVTFLFTDVEGSTKLLHELGADAYADALAAHRRVVREAVAAHGGVEVDTQGDAFFIAFPTAPGALAAAAEARDALAGLSAFGWGSIPGRRS